MSYKRVILITGSTDGIGKQTVKDLLVDASNFIIIHGRSAEKCERTIDDVAKSAEEKQRLGFVVGDMCELKQMLSMAKDVEKRFPALNTLLCNAGVLHPKRELTKDGVEMTLQVNHLAHFTLVEKLREVLKRNAPSRIILVSSLCHAWYSLDQDDMEATKGYEKYEQYSRTKLMNVMHALYLHKQLSKDGVAVCSLEPGVIQTKLLANGGYSGAPVESGTKASVFCVNADAKAIDGHYITSDGRVNSKKIYEQARDEKVQKWLWDYSFAKCRELGAF